MNRKNLLLLTLLCTSLLFGRVVYTHSLSFLFLLWNLFLAYLPCYIISKVGRVANGYLKWLLFLLGMLFLPNAPYIVTDLLHLKKNLVAPLWLDAVLILSFALTGLLLFVNTVDQMSMIVKDHYSGSKSVTYLLKTLMVILSAYGIYLGRFLRFNSWDIVADPFSLFYHMARSVSNSGHFKETMAITFTFSLFLFIVCEIYENAQVKTGNNPPHETKNECI